MILEPPVVPIALDGPAIDEALAMAAVGVKAGVDGLEAGTPLIVARGMTVCGRESYPRILRASGLNTAFPERG